MPLQAQTTGAISWEIAELEMSTDGPSTWVNISGSTNQVDNTGGDIATAVAYTHTSLIPLVGYGAAALRQIHIMGLYTEDQNEAFKKLRDAHYARTDIWLRFSPKGIYTGTKKYTTHTRGRITSFKEPSGQAGTANFVVLDCQWTGTSIDEGTN